MNLEYYFSRLIDTLGKDTWTYILLFVIIFSIILTVLSKSKMFEENKAVAPIISLAVSLIGLWYLSETQFASILFSYNALGILILFLLPFFLILIFLHKGIKSPGLRKIILAVFGAIYIYFWFENQYAIEEIWGIAGLALIILTIILDKKISESFNAR